MTTLRSVRFTIVLGAGAVLCCPAAGVRTAFAAEVHSLTASRAMNARDLVYVSDQLQKAVLAFPASQRAKNPGPAEIISFGVIPEGVWVDRSGVLYVALSGQSPSQFGSIEEFKPGRKSPFVTITSGITVPDNIVVDAQGTMYVDQVHDLSIQILEYPPGATSPSKVIAFADKGEPRAGAMTLDSKGNLYIHASFVDDPPARVFRLAPNAKAPRDLRLADVGQNLGLSSDARDNLYVGDLADGIAVYSPGERTPRRLIPVHSSQDFFGLFVATRSGSLYVPDDASAPSGSQLLEFPPGRDQPVNALSGSLQAPFSAALSAAAF